MRMKLHSHHCVPMNQPIQSDLSPSTLSVKNRIDQAAIHLFGTQGVDATAVPSIAERAGVAVGSIYRHYANKGAMVKSLYRTHYAALDRDLAHAIDQERGTAAKIAAMIAVVCDLLDRDWALGRFLLMEQHSALTGFDHPHNPVDTVHRVIEDGLRLGEIRPIAPGLAASFIMGPVVQLATFKLYGRFQGALRPHADDLAYTVWAGLRPALPLRPTTPGETV